MADWRSIRITRERGAAVSVGGRTLVPIALVASLHLARRGSAGGAFTWVRPLAVEVHEGLRVTTLPVPDLTMWGTIGLGVLGAVGAAVATSTARSRRTGGTNR